MRKQWLIVAAATLSLVTVAVAATQDAAPQDSAAQDTATQTAEAPADGVTQPIQFPHNVHAGTYQMECMYCHFSATRSVDAGIPPVSTCVGCHMVVTGEAGSPAAAEIAKIAEYAQRGEAIPWVRIYKVRDHVKFPHLRHVNAGVTCQTCHGQVQEMGVLTERAPEWGANNMGWCVSCHVERGASRDCTVCHY
jgi:hypothetical protein